MWKLLRKNISAGQLTGFSIANLIGLTIVILAVQFYGDVKPLFNDEESFISRDYLVITHKGGSAMGAQGGTLHHQCLRGVCISGAGRRRSQP